MSDFAIKQRLNRAIKSAIKLLDQPPGSYEIILLNNHVFHIEAIRKKEIRKIRPEICTKEIWAKKERGRGFEIREIG